MSIKLLTDSTACLTKEFCDRENIGIIESLLCINGEYKRDLSDIQRSNFLRTSDKFEYNIFSTQADSNHVIKIIEDAILEGYEEIFYIGVSKTITNQFEIVEFVSDLYKDRIGITLFQSGTMGASQGGMVLIANKMLKKGESVKKITTLLGKRRNDFKTYIISKSFKTIFKTGKIRSRRLISAFAKFLGRFR
ncbi:MAG: DegV family protein, partial [Candidatus Heimdallarchaeaceae archaeon]